MDFKGIMLSEINQTEKDKYYNGITYIWNLKKLNSETQQNGSYQGIGDEGKGKMLYVNL